MSDTDQLKAVAAALQPKPPRPTNTLLGERERTHGPFSENARISQDFKQYVYTKANPPRRAEHRESMDQICLKIARILSGDADFKEHWEDIAGYAILAANACPNQSS